VETEKNAVPDGRKSEKKVIKMRSQMPVALAVLTATCAQLKQELVSLQAKSNSIGIYALLRRE
jgi:hypothetical protein